MKAAVLGCGNMGMQVLDHLKKCEHITGVVGYDIDEARIKEAKSKLAVETTNDLSSIWSDSKIPLVFITSPNGTHYELATQALNAKKAVMCEKPMGNTLEEAREIVELSEKLDAFLQIGFEARYSKLYTKIKDWIDEGLLGEIVNTHLIYITNEFIGKNSWRIKKEHTGSMFGEKLSHYVDLPRWWIGSPVMDVITFCSPNVVPYYEIRDNYHTTYRFQNGAASHLTFMMAVAESTSADPMQNWLDELRDQGNELRYTIQGTRGAAQTDIYDRRVKRWEFTDTPERLASKLVEHSRWDLEESNAYGHNTYDQTHDIVRRIVNGLPPFTTPRDSLETMELCFAAEESADKNERIYLNQKSVSVSSI